MRHFFIYLDDRFSGDPPTLIKKEAIKKGGLPCTNTIEVWYNITTILFRNWM